MFRSFSNHITKSVTQFVSSSNRTMSSSTTGSNCQRLKGKVAIVTASTDGIGFASAKRLAEEGATVFISSRKEKNVNQAVEKLRSAGLDVHGTTCHVGSAEDRTKMFKMVEDVRGGLDILVSNAAINPYFGKLLDTPESAWDKIMEVNVKAAFLLTKEALPLMKKRGGGSIIYISSIAGYRPFPALGAYSISKTALLGLTKAVADELALDKIRVNVVCPGVIKTRFSDALTTNEGISEEMLKYIPVQRFGVPDDIAGVVAFLASDDAAYITGESIVASGGFYSRL